MKTTLTDLLGIRSAGPFTVEGGGIDRYLLVGLLLTVLTVLLYGGVRAIWLWNKDVSYSTWAGIALGIAVVLAFLVASESAYRSNGIVVSVLLMMAPILGVVIVSATTTLAGVTTWDSNPVWTFLLASGTMLVLGALAYLVGIGVRWLAAS